MSGQVIDRIFMAVLILTVTLVGFYEPESLTYRMIQAGGFWAFICSIALIVLSTMAIIDVVINDILPHNYTWPCGIKWRQGLWIVIGITYAGLAFAVSKSQIGGYVIAVYLLYAFRCIAMSFIDLYNDHLANLEHIKGVRRGDSSVQT